MIILLEDEADSFWCFERLMRRLVLTLHIFSMYLCFDVDYLHLFLCNQGVLNLFSFFELKSEEISAALGDLLELKLNLLIWLQLLRLLTPNFTNI